MSQSAKVISIASAEIGNKEANGGDDKYIKWYGGFALTVAWCAIFVSWVFFMFNKNKYFPKFASCDVGLKWFMDNGKFQMSKAYKGTYTPKQGDLIFFSSVKSLSDSTHVGIVTKSDRAYIYTVEGNASDMVKEKKYLLTDPTILGYGVVPYTDAKIIPATDNFNYKDWLKRLCKALNLPQTTKVAELLKKTPTLKKGDKNVFVGLLQEYLVAQGYDLGDSGKNHDGVDEKFGDKTDLAVKTYQQKVVGLAKPDGILDNAQSTWKKILNVK